MDRGAIGVFDSGIGGLTVAREISRRLPAEDLIYLGDTARLPYGTKSAETVRAYALKCAAFLAQEPLKALVVACNTASAVALPDLRARLPMEVIGVIEPGARAAAAATRSGRIGVIGTEGTVRSRAYERAIHALRPDAEVVSHPCPLLVPLAEEGWTDNDVTRLVLRKYLAPLAGASVDTLVLGCTHYPLFKDLMRRVLSEDFGVHVALVDSAEAVTEDLTDMLRDRDLLHPCGGLRRFHCTDAPERFSAIGRRFFGEAFNGVSQVDI